MSRGGGAAVPRGALVSASPQAFAEIRAFFDRQDERTRAAHAASAARARTLADLHRRRNIEWDVVSRVSMQRTVFDVLGSMPGAAVRCPAPADARCGRGRVLLAPRGARRPPPDGRRAVRRRGVVGRCPVTATTSAPPLTAEEALLSLAAAQTGEERFAAFRALVSARGQMLRPIELVGVGEVIAEGPRSVTRFVAGAGAGLLGGSVPDEPGLRAPSVAKRAGRVMRRHEAAAAGTASPTGWQEVTSW